METLEEVMEALKDKGSEQTRKTFARHGAPDSMYGVKVGDMKPIARKIRGKQTLALALYDSGNPDAMYLAGMVADGSQMTKRQLDGWAKSASWHMLSEYTVPGVAAEHGDARGLAMKWIRSRTERIAAAGWCTYAGVLATRADGELNLDEIRGLLKTIENGIHEAPNRVRYTMNGFVIAAGSFVAPLHDEAVATAGAIGKVECDMGDTACKVPLASTYIDKVVKRSAVGKKRKTIKC